jgi:hypothetical protein
MSMRGATEGGADAKPGLDRLTRLLVFAAAVTWLMAVVLMQQRSYQDGWILEGIVAPFAGFLLVAALLIRAEKDDRYAAWLCAVTVALVSLVPSLKYREPYGTTLDAGVHFALVRDIMATGRIPVDHSYATIPGMHAWLASLGVLAGVSPALAVKIGLPLQAGFVPLFVTWLSRRFALPPRLTRLNMVLSCFTIFEAYVAYGTGFSLVPFLMILGVLAVREFVAVSPALRRRYLLVSLLFLAQVLVWHSSTPLVLAAVLAAASLTPLLVWLTGTGPRRPRLAMTFAWFAVLTCVTFMLYHGLLNDPVHNAVVGVVRSALGLQERVQKLVPPRFFEITMGQRLQIAAVLHGRDLAIAGLAGLGTCVVWARRRAWAAALPLYVFALLVCAAHVAMLVTALIGVNYLRFTLGPVIVAALLAGPAVWALETAWQTRTARSAWWRPLGRVGSTVGVIALAAITVVQVLRCQPLVPKVAVDLGEREYVLWVHEVNTAYKWHLLQFAAAHTQPDTSWATDYHTRSQYIRYLGYPGRASRYLEYPLLERTPPEGIRSPLLILHRVGRAGGYAEQVEMRTRASIQELSLREGWGRVYDNGESFMILLP